MLFRRKQFLAFGCPSPRFLVSPSKIAREILALNNSASLMIGLLIGSLVLNIAMLLIAFGKADIDPYVADGGLFGCAVKVVETVR